MCQSILWASAIASDAMTVLRCPVLSAISASKPSASCHSSPSGKRHRPRCSDGVVLRGVHISLGQQDLCQRQYSSFQQELPSAMQVMVFRCLALSAISASRPSATRQSSPFQRDRQRCSDGAVLLGALSHLCQQAQCQLPIFIPPAGAIVSNAVVVLCCAVIYAISTSNPMPAPSRLSAGQVLTKSGAETNAMAARPRPLSIPTMPLQDSMGIHLESRDVT